MTIVNLKLIPGVNNTGDKFTAGVKDTSDKLMTGVKDTGDKTLNSNISTILRKNSKWL